MGEKGLPKVFGSYGELGFCDEWRDGGGWPRNVVSNMRAVDILLETLKRAHYRLNKSASRFPTGKR